MFTADIRVIFTVNRIILTGDCYGARWRNVVGLCDLPDGVDKTLREKKRATDIRSAIIRDICSGEYPLRENP